MTFAENLATVEADLSSPCSVGLALAALGDEDRTAAVVALSDANRPDAVLLSALAMSGYLVDRLTLEAHRRGACTCILGGA